MKGLRVAMCDSTLFNLLWHVDLIARHNLMQASIKKWKSLNVQEQQSLMKNILVVMYKSWQVVTTELKEEG